MIIISLSYLYIGFYPMSIAWLQLEIATSENELRTIFEKVNQHFTFNAWQRTGMPIYVPVLINACGC